MELRVQRYLKTHPPAGFLGGWAFSCGRVSPVEVLYTGSKGIRVDRRDKDIRSDKDLRSERRSEKLTHSPMPPPPHSSAPFAPTPIRP